jgi:glycine oxidase
MMDQGRRRALLSKSSHVVVVGGGVFGCAIAYQLARRGFSPTLLERDEFGSHASGRNAGKLNPIFGAPSPLIPLALESFRLHQALAAELSELGCPGYGLKPVRRIYLVFDEPDRADLDKACASFEGMAGFSTAWLDAEELHRIEPRLAPEIKAGLLVEGNMSVDSHAFTGALAEGAVRLGTAVVRANVTGLDTADGMVRAVRTGRGEIACDAVVFATGPWVVEMREWLGLALPVEPVKGEMLRMKWPGERLRDDFTHGTTTLYGRGRDEVWIGVTKERAGFDESPTEGGRRSLLERAGRIMPAIKQAVVLEHIAALRPMTPTGMPIVGQAPGWANVYLANGGGVKGVLLCTGIAQAVCDLILTGRTGMAVEPLQEPQ